MEFEQVIAENSIDQDMVSRGIDKMLGKNVEEDSQEEPELSEETVL